MLFGLESTAASAAPPTTQFMVGRCYYQGNPIQQRPTEVYYGCDGTGILKNMTWTEWDARGANGSGRSDETDCLPDCASGGRYQFPIVVHADNPITPTGPACPAGVQFYSDLLVAYPDETPPWLQPNGPDVTQYHGMPAVHYDDTPNC
jgi:hypothetical protein